MNARARLLRYGIGIDLARRAEDAGLTVAKIRALARRDIATRFRLSEVEASELKRCVTRQPIAPDTVELLLSRSNHACCVCKGVKSGAIIIHHIKEYEVSQDNSYGNLAVLCPSDHDRAHRPGGLSLGLTAEQIHRAKDAWEKRVELLNVQTAARAIRVDHEAIDYVNVMRIEEMCVRRLGGVPTTTIGPHLRKKGILDNEGRFDEVYVRRNLSGGCYLFDYHNSCETEHYRQLLGELSQHVPLEDLSEAARSGIRKLRAIEGKYAYFVGCVHSKRPHVPIDRSTPPFVLHHTTKRVRITWDGDANYLMSMSAIGRQGRPNRYLVYCLVRTVLKSDKGRIEVTASPLLIAQPSAYVDRTPAIACRRYHDGDEEVSDEEGDES
jgi:hypothetical protein